MTARILAIVTVLALPAGLITSAQAFDHKPGHSGNHASRVHAGGTQGFRARHGSRFGWDGGSSHQTRYKNLGPLGIQFPCVPGGYCGQGFSVSAWSW